MINIKKLSVLNFEKQLTFSYLTCERLYPNYPYFSQQYNFGDPQLLRECIDLALKAIFDRRDDVELINQKLGSLDKAIPEPGDFDTILASSALDAGCAIEATLNYIVTKNTQFIIDISTYATDTVEQSVY